MIRKDFQYTLIAALLALGATAAQAASPAPTTSIDTLVSVAYQTTPSGDTQIVFSNDASVSVSAASAVQTPVARKAGVALTPVSGSQSISRLTRTVFPLTLRNTGIGTDTFTLTLTPPQGWHATLIYDSYGDGVLHPGEVTPAPAQVALAAGGSQPFLVVVIPPILLRSGTSGATVLRAVSGTDATQASQATLVTSFTGVG